MSGAVPRIAAGSLDKSVQLQSPNYTKDDAGAELPTTYTTEAIVRAKVEPLSDSMSALAGQAFGQISHRVTIRAHAGVKSDWRVLFGARVLNLVGPPRDIDERHVYMELRCNEVEVMP